MEIIINSYGSKLSCKNNCLVFSNKETKEKRFLSILKVTSIVVETECSITKAAFAICLKKGIPIFFLNNRTYDLLGFSHTLTKNKYGLLKMKQYKVFSDDSAISIGKNWIILKMESQKKHLEKALKSKKREDLLKNVLIINSYIKKILLLENIKENKEKILGFEGISSKIYYKSISEILDKKWKFSHRETRGAKQEYNICLNYLYAIIYRKLTIALVKAGFEIGIGIIHVENNYNSPLLYDFIEPFRFFAFETCYEYFSQKFVRVKHFEDTNKGKILTKEGKEVLLQLFYNKCESNIKIHRKNFHFNSYLKNSITTFKKLIMEEK